LLSVPALKAFGHAAVIIRNRKYELRLDRSTNRRPVFQEQELTHENAQKIRTSFGNRWIIIGETKMTDDEIRNTFNQVINQFGPYDTIHNNCRHFVYYGCASIIPSSRTWVWDQEGSLRMAWSTLRMDLYPKVIFGKQGEY
jgi:hypothetical protein